MKLKYSINQRLMAYILLIGLFLQSCSNLGIPTKPVEIEPNMTTVDNPIEVILPVDQSITDVSVNTTAVDLAIRQAPSNLEENQPAHALSSQLFQTKQGQTISFYQEAEEWKAKVRENFGSFSRDLVAPVYFEGVSLPKSLQTSKIHVLAGNGKKPYVYVGKLGLPGGMIQEIAVTNQLNVAMRELRPVEYITGNFECKEKPGPGGEIELSTPHRNSTKSLKQEIQIYNEKLKILPYEHKIHEKVLMRLTKGKDKKGKDGRSRIINTNEWPYRFHGQLAMYYPGQKDPWTGSGTLVGPQHILTAAHNIYDIDSNKWARKVSVRLGLNDTEAPYGEALVNRMYTFKSYIDQKDSAYDMALLVLNRPIGLNTGWCGLLAAYKKDLLVHEVNITGYPADKGSKQMWTMSHNLKDVQNEKLIYEIDTDKGQSGSGIWLNHSGNTSVVGVHAYGLDPNKIGNSGVRLSYAKAKQVLNWINETFDFKVKDKHTTRKLPIRRTPSSQKFANQENADVQTKRGREYQDRRKYDQALICYEKAAEQGNSEAQCSLGDMYYNGYGVAKDYQKALTLFQKSAAKGSAYAQDKLGYMYENGYSVAKDYNKALMWYKKAAKQGNPDAKNSLNRLKYS